MPACGCALDDTAGVLARIKANLKALRGLIEPPPR
jgi:hypothetical protein